MTLISKRSCISFCLYCFGGQEKFSRVVVQTRREVDNMESSQLGKLGFLLDSSSSLQGLCGLSTLDFVMETKRVKIKLKKKTGEVRPKSSLLLSKYISQEPLKLSGNLPTDALVSA